MCVPYSGFISVRFSFFMCKTEVHQLHICDKFHFHGSHISWCIAFFFSTLISKYDATNLFLVSSVFDMIIFMGLFLLRNMEFFYGFSHGATIHLQYVHFLHLASLNMRDFFLLLTILSIMIEECKPWLHHRLITYDYRVFHNEWMWKL